MEDDNHDEYLSKIDRFFSGEEETTLATELAKRGLSPAPLEGLTDEDVSRVLTDLVWSLADLRVFISDTDHLTDRELYQLLLEYCQEPTFSVAEFPDAACHWSPIGSGSEEDSQIWLRYYANEDDRAMNAVRYPDEPIPPSELPPYPRPWIPVCRYLPLTPDEGPL